MNQTFLELLAEIEDFRKGNAIHYRLQDILLVSVLAVICNMDTSQVRLIAVSGVCVPGPRSKRPSLAALLHP